MLCPKQPAPRRASYPRASTSKALIGHEKASPTHCLFASRARRDARSLFGGAERRPYVQRRPFGPRQRAAPDPGIRGLVQRDLLPDDSVPGLRRRHRIKRGTAYVWGKSFAFGAGGSLCFSEFISFSLNESDLQVVSGTNGTCGAPIDPSLKPPLHADLGALVVIAGGGDGMIAEGTGRLKNWTGT